MEVPVIYLFTHDSIGVGEDGPTHQPIEQLASLRAIPGLVVIRPGDANEVVEAWKYVMQLKHEPVCLILSRQDLLTLDRTRYAPAAGLHKGAYTLADAADGKPDVLLLATGSEVQLCVGAYEQLKKENIKARIDPSQKPMYAPPGCRLENACGAGPFTRALSSSRSHITQLIRTPPLYTPIIPAQRAAHLVVTSSYMHSPTAIVFDVPSLISS